MNFVASNIKSFINYHQQFTPFRSVYLFVDELTKDGTKNDYMANMATKGQLGRAVGSHEGKPNRLEQVLATAARRRHLQKAIKFLVFLFLVFLV